MLNEEQLAIYHSFANVLYEDIKNDKESFPHKRPLLAHYTSIGTLEKILTTDEIWFSNPLFMNDLQEMRFGILEGNQLFHESQEIRQACGAEARYLKVVEHFDYYFDQAANNQVLDVYAFCASEHDADKHKDGRLSMWRGYGGNGKGVAIVFDTSKLKYIESGSPLIVSRVVYASTEDRRVWLSQLMQKFAELLRTVQVADELLYLPVAALFSRIKIFALFTKHDGFLEEQEWRVVYLKELDTGKMVTAVPSYIITDQNGVEPKLKFKVMPVPDLTSDDFSMNKLIHQIILGPSISSLLAKGTVLRMLDTLNKPEFKGRVHASSIPYRAG